MVCLCLCGYETKGTGESCIRLAVQRALWQMAMQRCVAKDRLPTLLGVFGAA